MVFFFFCLIWATSGVKVKEESEEENVAEGAQPVVPVDQGDLSGCRALAAMNVHGKAFLKPGRRVVFLL